MNRVTIVHLFIICVLSIAIRLFPLVIWGSVIHEYDPHFNFRVTKFLAQEGVYDLLDWFDDRSWYPLGRLVGGTLYPGLMYASALIYWGLSAIGFPVAIRHICVMLAPGFAALTSITLYLLTLEVTGRSTSALLASALIGISPSYISRSTAGSYDNEGIAIFLLILTFYFWLKSAKTGSMFWSCSCALSYFAMVVSWGGYVFIINILPIHVLMMILSGRYSSRIYIAYSTFYPLATLLAMQVPFVGFNAVKKAESVASHGMFFLLQAYAFVIWLQSLLSAAQFKRLFNFLLVGAALIAGPGVIVLMLTGKLQWSGRSLTLLDPTYASKYIPIIASVGEHQPTAWGSFIMNLGPVQLLAPLGLYYCFHRLDESYLFMIIYSTFSWYFSGIMVRLLLTLAPAACFLSAVGISAFVDCISIMSSNIQNNVIEQDDNAADTATNPITADSSSTVSASSIFTGANQKRNKRAKHTPTPPTSRTSNSHAVNDEDWFAEAETICKERIRFKYPKERVQLDTLHGVPSSLALLLVAVCLLFFVHIRHCSSASRKGFSSTSLVYERYNRTSRESSVHDDYREAYAWLRENTKDDATILSWWDYGYQLSSLANRTVLVDNNTWNNTHIATVGRVFASSEEDALPILQSLGVDYIFLLFGGKSGMSGDDLDKFPWFLRIAQGVFPDDVIENDFRSNGYLKFQENSTHAVTSSLIYKLSYYGFDQVEDYNEVTTGKGLEATKGYDRSRRRVVTTKPIILNHFEEAFTSDEWIVRIFRFRSSSL